MEDHKQNNKTNNFCNSPTTHTIDSIVNSTKSYNPRRNFNSSENRSDLFLPLYHPQSWRYAQILSQHDNNLPNFTPLPHSPQQLAHGQFPYQLMQQSGQCQRRIQSIPPPPPFPSILKPKTTKEETLISTKMHPLFLDDVRSAALALTSLSLSPASTRSADDVNETKNWSPKSYFIFPPANTPTEELPLHDIQKHQKERNISDSSLLHSSSSPRLFINESNAQRSDNRGVENSSLSVTWSRTRKSSYFDVDELASFKPRSYSHHDYDHDSTKPVPILSKPRSYSFDAVGRASNNISGSENKQVGYHSAPISQSRMIKGRLGTSSVDDGIGSSSGSADSVEHIPSKRKLASRTLFRCMWRGCDKELTSLPGIILHVRNAHIGASNAGEEEFYFDDVNVDSSTTTSGISSSEENMNENCKKKYRKSISEEADEKFCEEYNYDKILDMYVKLGSNLTETTDEIVLQTNTVSTAISEANNDANVNLTSGTTCKTLPEVCKESIKIKSTPHAIMDILPKKTDSRLPGNMKAARHLNSPSFNMNFSTNLQASSTTLMFLPSEMTTKRRTKGRKKCRKVYGMSNKDLWCTQCRWKKACTRFA